MTPATENPTSFRRALALASAFALIAAVSATSFAAGPAADDPPSVKVHFDDLDLSTAAGANALYHRIWVAARRVCPDIYSRDLAIVAASERCQATAIANAVRALNNPQVALVHAAHGSRG
jgi:UrcA family protein